MQMQAEQFGLQNAKIVANCWWKLHLIYYSYFQSRFESGQITGKAISVHKSNETNG